jgi:hypothetical protein
MGGSEYERVELVSIVFFVVLWLLRYHQTWTSSVTSSQDSYSVPYILRIPRFHSTGMTIRSAFASRSGMDVRPAL